MVSRKDQLNAYTFARRRTVAAFLQPTPARSEEGAPRPVRTILPSIVAGTLLLAGFGAWGIIKPAAPPDWKEPGKYILVGSESTTRYVVLRTDGRKQLHPVLNLASARLVLDPGEFTIVKVKESELDKGGLHHGATIGIPYAPDRLPRAQDARTAKTWAACIRPDQGGSNPSSQRSVLVLASDADKAKVGRGHPGTLKGRQALYAEGPDGTRYLIDAKGTRYPIGGKEAADDPEYLDLLLRPLFRQGAQPQRVTAEWLDTFNEGTPITFPVVEDMGAPAGVKGLPPAVNRVGKVLRAPAGPVVQSYVVLKGRVAPVSDLVAELLLRQKAAESLYPGQPKAVDVAAQSLTPDPERFYGDRGWPEQVPEQVNDVITPGGRDVACSVYHGRTSANGRHRLSVWAGTDTPLPVAPGGAGTYVTPGSGLLFREVQGTATGTGSTYLLTDTGLRYGIQVNSDSPAAKTKETPAERRQGEAQTRLGYGGIRPVPVPAAWAGLLSKGPTLDTAAALQPQGS